MSEKRLGIIMNGVTGRMGKNQHLIRSILEIMKAGGLELADGTRVMPDPILVGRNAGRVADLAREHGFERSTNDLDAAIAKVFTEAKFEVFQGGDIEIDLENFKKDFAKDGQASVGSLKQARTQCGEAETQFLMVATLDIFLPSIDKATGKGVQWNTDWYRLGTGVNAIDSALEFGSKKIPAIIDITNMSIPKVAKAGDVDFNGDLNVLDVIILINFIIDVDQPDTSELTASDLNDDGDLNIQDIILLINIILN